MSISVPITPSELKTLQRQLRKEQNFVCIDSAVHVKVLLVARDMLMRGKDVKAKIIKGYDYEKD